MSRPIAKAVFCSVAFFVSVARDAPGGWYLMEPPSVQTLGDRLYLAVPNSRWIILESFDRAPECEKARREARQDGTLGTAQRYPACVATDDPRLAERARNAALFVPGAILVLPQRPALLLPLRRDRPARTLGR